MRSSGRLGSGRACRGIAAAGKVVRTPCTGRAPWLSVLGPCTREGPRGPAGRLAAGVAPTVVI